MQSLCNTPDSSPSEDVPRYSALSPISCNVLFVPPPKNRVAAPWMASGSNRPQTVAEHIPSPTPVSPISLHPSATAAVGRPNPYHYTAKYTGPSGLYSSPQGIPAAQFNDALRKELVGNTLNANSNFLERLLPREGLPFPVDEGLLRKLSAPMPGCTNLPIWNKLKSCFRQIPIDFGEAAVCKWLNNIGTTMGLIYGRQCERLWWSGRCRVPLIGSSTSIHRAPDLILLDRSYYHKSSETDFPVIEWAFVKALAEVDHSNTQLAETVNGKSYLTFLRQPHRRFTISLSFSNAKKGQFAVIVTDRVCQMCVKEIDLIGSPVENSILLLSILAYLMFGSPEDIGIDPHFEINPSNGQVIAIECQKRRFEVVKRVHSSSSLFGRGTQVWVVVYEGIKYIMKDYWVRDDHIHDEAVHLGRMASHQALKDRVPTLICVVINGLKDSTRHYGSPHSSHRIHRRIVTSPVGESITTFKSKKEFIRIMISIIETHHYLHNIVGILHGDLSVGNILLNRRDNESENIRLLIDFDHSVDCGLELEDANHQDPQHMPDSADYACTAENTLVEERKSQMSVTRTGTPPFMAIEALLAFNRTFVHKPKHDLESILYIILYICTFVRGPGLLLNESDVTRNLPMRTWFGNGNIRQIGYHKLAHLDCHDHAILPHFTPYWQDFVPFVKDLIVACFPVRASLPSELQYEKALRILKRAYDAVREPSDSTAQAPQARDLASKTGIQTSKRPNNSSLCRDSKKGKLVSLRSPPF